MNYKKIATEASEYERSGNLRMALIMWEQAAKAACKNQNCEYAQNRADFCRKWGCDSK